MGEIIPSESVSHVTYTGIDSMHFQKKKYMKTALQIAKNRTAKNSKAKEDASAQKPKKWMDPRPANFSEDNPSLLKKRAGWKLAQENSVKRSQW